MRKIILSALIVLGVMKGYTQSTTPLKDVDKMVVLTNADYDMGKIPAGVPLEYKVTIKNISKDTVILKEVKAGCGCTTPKYRTNEKILPGKSTYISLGFNGDGHGEFSKFADLYFNDGSITKQVKFHGITYTDSTQKPPMVNMNR